MNWKTCMSARSCLASAWGTASANCEMSFFTLKFSLLWKNRHHTSGHNYTTKRATKQRFGFLLSYLGSEIITGLGAPLFFLIFEAFNAMYQCAYQNGIVLLHWTDISLEVYYDLWSHLKCLHWSTLMKWGWAQFQVLILQMSSNFSYWWICLGANR